MFTVSVQTRFRASHQLTKPRPYNDQGRGKPSGSRERAHTHNWLVTAEVCCSRLDKRGLVMDFSRLRNMVDNIISERGATALLEKGRFKLDSPSAENVARFIYQRLWRKLPKAVRLLTVRVTEEPGCWAQFGR